MIFAICPFPNAQCNKNWQCSYDNSCLLYTSSSSDSSMPFSIVAASCVGMAAVVRVDAILKRLLPRCV